MISKPKFGWCNFEIDDFCVRPSYLTDVPTDLLDCFLSYYERCAGACFFDLEGDSFTLVLSDSQIFVVLGDGSIRYFTNFTIKELAKSLIVDISANLEDWVLWNIADDENNRTEYLARKQKLLEKTVRLEYYINK